MANPLSAVSSDKLHVVCAYNNPNRWDSRLRLTKDFLVHMKDSGVNITVAECAYGDRPYELDHIPFVNHVPLRAATVIWSKENLLNLAMSRLEDDTRYIAWIDADIKFRDADWAAKTVDALQLYDIVQPWAEALDLGPNDQVMQTHKSFCYQYWSGQPVIPTTANFWKFNNGPYDYPHSGYAWAARRNTLDNLGGLIDYAILGAGDHHMALALVGGVKYSMPGVNDIAIAYQNRNYAWQDRATRFVAGNLGYVQNTIEHFFHGRKVDRKYIDRWQIANQNKYDPDTDLVANTWGVLELAGNKPNLRMDLYRYFAQRNEDVNSLD